MKDKFISIIIPTFNRRKILKRTIESFTKQSCPLDKFELIIVDDNSTDGTNKMVKEIIPNSEIEIKYFKQENKGPAAARNLGIKNAKGDIILFTGDDCIPHFRLIEEHIKSHQENKNVVVLGYVDWHPELDITPFMDFITRGVQFDYPAINNPENVSFRFFVTANISMKKKLLFDIGLFSEDFPFAAFEDTELGYRFWKKGIRIIFNKNAITYHYHLIGFKNFAERQKKSGRSAVILYKKNPELKEILGINNVSNPEFAFRFYEALVHYYYLAGVTEGLKDIENISDESSAWLKEEFKGSQEKWMFELLLKIRESESQIHKLQLHIEKIHRSVIFRLYLKVRSKMIKYKFTRGVWNIIKKILLVAPRQK